MKKTNIFFWIFNGLFAAMMLFSAIPDVLATPEAAQFMHDGLGYPVYFIPFIGVAKVLGIIAILVPGSYRIKEWAYAGLFFDLIGAFFSLTAANLPEGSPIFMVLPLALGAAAYFFYRRKQKLAAAKGNPTSQGQSFTEPAVA